MTDTLTVFYAGGALKTLLIIIVIFYAFRFVMRLVGPWILKKGVENMTRKAEEKMRSHQGTSSGKPEGTITVEKVKKTQSDSSKSDGDFVDFEEID